MARDVIYSAHDLSMHVIDWLLDSDPAIRWQVMRDLTDAPAAEVAAERSRIVHEGWGAQILAAQDADGRWGGGTFIPRWIGTSDTLPLLYLFGIDPDADAVRRAIAPIHEAARWDYDPDLRFWEGEVEPCINGRTVTVGAYFGQDVQRIVDRLLSEQMADGGWNCDPRASGRRSSFHESLPPAWGLHEYWLATGATWAKEAAARAAELFLSHRLFRSLSDGEVIDRRWLALHYPPYWHYDVLQALLILSRLGKAGDPRAGDALELLVARVLAREGRFDYLLVESTGLSEPLPGAEPRLGRRTVLIFPLLPPPQKN